MKTKYKWMLVVILCVCTLITSCSSEMKPVDENRANTDIFVYVDPKTGVNYLVFQGYKQGGMTVRYNSDGSIMITEKDGEVDVSR